METLPNKISLTENWLENISIFLSAIGVSHFHNESIKYRLFYNKTLINVVLVIFIVKETTSLLLKNSKISLMLGDMAYNQRFKIVWNLIIINGALTPLLVRLLHYWCFKHGSFPMKINGLKNVIQVPEKYEKIIMIMKLLNLILAKIIPFCVFVMYFITLSMSASYYELLTFGLIWSISMIPFSHYVVNTVFGNLLYFFVLAYKFKLQLQLENHRLKQLSIKQLPKALIEWQLMRIITRIFKIHKQVKHENKFWSKWLFIQIGFMATFAATLVNHVVFGEMNQIFRIFLILILSFFIAYIYLVNICCIELYKEANGSVKIMYSLNMQILCQHRQSSNFKIKVIFSNFTEWPDHGMLFELFIFQDDTIHGNIVKQKCRILLLGSVYIQSKSIL